MIEYAVLNGVIKDLSATRDVLASKIMDLVTPRPSAINKIFWSNYDESPLFATDAFYEMCKMNNYIKTREIKKNILFTYTSEKYGDIQITINLSKPEKDPKEIALALQVKEENVYPANPLVLENEGYAGHLTHPGRMNHRIIRLDLLGEKWGFQYSPYSYYNEHSIVLSLEPRPMKINQKTLENLIEFTSLLPHYFVGSNADLPIVGGSILTHDHYQAGRHQFPIEKASYAHKFEFRGCPDVTAGIIQWPMSTIRLRSDNPK